MTVELVILNYNGRHHLEHLLPTALREAQNYGPDCQVVVLDNRSTQGDVAWVTRDYPWVKAWVAPRNEYLFSYNEYAKQSTAGILVLLNNDLKLCENFLPPLLRHFAQEDVFSVGATSLDWEGKEFTCGPSILRYQNGFYDWKYDCSRQELCHTFFTSGGFMAVDRVKFLKIGGFDSLYYPAYVEDVDLCFRAWRNGWRCIFEPASQVLHREGGSWKATKDPTIDSKILRNSLLFQWCNLPTNKDKWKRRWSVAKISLGEFTNLRFHWMTTYFQTLFEIRNLKIRKGMKTLPSKEMDKIMKAVSIKNAIYERDSEWLGRLARDPEKSLIYK
jgi:N-acetylglucosaminyl-diphospho-decaprenol L-rhamnosyltransferase